MRRVRRFLLKMAVILAGPILAMPAWAQLQPLPIFQSKGSFTIQTTVGGALTVSTGKVDATAFGSLLVEVTTNCPAPEQITFYVKGTNDKALAIGSYPYLNVPNATRYLVVGTDSFPFTIEVQPIPSFINVVLEVSVNTCWARMVGILAPFTGLVSIQGSTQLGATTTNTRPVIVGGAYVSPVGGIALVNAAGITNMGALFTTSVGASSTAVYEKLVAAPGGDPTKCVTRMTQDASPLNTVKKWIWLQNNGPDPIRCALAVTDSCINDGFLIPADGGNMSVEITTDLWCVVVGVAAQISGAATNVVVGRESNHPAW